MNFYPETIRFGVTSPDNEPCVVHVSCSGDAPASVRITDAETGLDLYALRFAWQPSLRRPDLDPLVDAADHAVSQLEQCGWLVRWCALEHFDDDDDDFEDIDRRAEDDADEARAEVRRADAKLSGDPFESYPRVFGQTKPKPTSEPPVYHPYTGFPGPDPSRWEFPIRATKPDAPLVLVSKDNGATWITGQEYLAKLNPKSAIAAAIEQVAHILAEGK